MINPHAHDTQEERVHNVGRPGRTPRRHSKVMRRVTGLAAVVFALVALGLTYSALAPSGNTAVAADETVTGDIELGQELYDRSCISCHGDNLQGVEGRGPSLIGVGQAATYFQVATGRMPAKANGAQMPRSIPFFQGDPETGVTQEEQFDAIAAYVHSVGGGAALPSDIPVSMEAVSKGAELYRLNCASCHNFTGRGGALSQGKHAPPLDQATDKEIYAAMLAGPESMPTFSDGQLTPDEKAAIISYVRASTDALSPGGYDLGGFGPVSEGLIAFLVGMGVIVSITLWTGSRR